MSNFESHRVEHPKSKGENPSFENGSKQHSVENLPNSSAPAAWILPEEIRGKSGFKPDGLPPEGNENYYTEHDAKTLSNLGNYALEHSTDRSAINAFQQELLEIRSHGQNYTKQVFNQVKADQNALANFYGSDDRLCFNANILALAGC